ncbi:MAG: phosphate ABC transporter permease PstA [Syntrophotaleaceae bacterium]
MKKFWRQGEPFIWGTAAALSITLLLAATLLVVVMVNGLGVFWPSQVALATLQDGSRVMGELVRKEAIYQGEGERLQFKVGNRDLYGLDFRWVDEEQIARLEFPENAVVLERQEYGNFYGMLSSVSLPAPAGEATDTWDLLDQAHALVEERMEVVEDIGDQLTSLNIRMGKLRNRQLELKHGGRAPADAALQQIENQMQQIREKFEGLVDRQNALLKELHEVTATFVSADGTEKVMEVANLVRYYRPNEMGLGEKVLFYLSKLGELILGEPREANTEGGLFPAIFGTVMLIFVMSLVSFPLGVLAAIYLREYAKDGLIVRLVRIAVNNLAGIPSIVYGIFGLAFFVYGIGSSIDMLFFPERLPNPTFGTGGILWASLTLSLLTVPVVIVSTEEALGAIPAGVRDGSLALGATKFQTLWRILLPMASPGIMTGLILAMARAAGEVAPLMITGVVKLAPALPLDGNFPYLHLDRKFMHLGFHIYDIGFQSPNVEAAKPMVFVTTLLLVLIVLVMSSIAIHLRNKMKKRYTYRAF